MGWLLLAMGMALAAMISTTQYANRTLVDAPGSLPFGMVAAWLQTWIGATVPGLLTLLLLVFPTGSPSSARWRVVAKISVAASLAVIAVYAFRPGHLETFRAVDNPLGINAIAPALGLIQVPATITIIVTALGAAASVIFRYRKSTGLERQQFKWFAYGTGTAIGLALMTPFAGVGKLPGTELDLGFVLPMFAFALLPTSIGLAILRYRLFDIERIISRTVSYALVTATLGGLFALVAVVPTAVIGSGDNPDWMTALATLMVVAAFRPVRRRVQVLVDRRFNRHSYDSQRTIESFAARLREQTDIDALGNDLQQIVVRTMQPEHISLWVKAQR